MLYRVTADQAGLQKIAEKFKKYDFSALLLVGGFEVKESACIDIIHGQLIGCSILSDFLFVSIQLLIFVCLFHIPVFV